MTIEGGECLVYSLQCFGSDMDRIESKLKELERLTGGFETMIEKLIVDNQQEVEMLIREQLLSGVDGNEKDLKPTYTSDPYFKERYGKNWRAKAEAYKNWKNDITPPSPSKIGFRARAIDTPNLIIEGMFHRSIKAEAIPGGLRIGTHGIDFGSDVEQKYHSSIFKVSRTANKYFIKKVIRKNVDRYFRLK